MQDNQSSLLEINQLNMQFMNSQGLLKPKRVIHAVKDVTLSITAGQTFGLVGESGCGKSTLGRTILRLNKPTSGQIIFQGEDIAYLKEKELKPFRKSMQSIFQDPLSSLNPHMTIEQIVGESLQIHGMYNGFNQQKQKREYIISILEKVGLQSSHLLRFPHEFSGGQRQRISIARALAVKPKFIICDEPLSALDVSIQAQVVNLLQDLQEEYGMTYLFIAHDLAMVKHISDNIGVMFLGSIVETATSNELYTNPLHPYTQMLLKAVPEIPKFNEHFSSLNEQKSISAEDGSVLEKNITLVDSIAQGCAYANRCPYAKNKCYHESPQKTEISGTHSVTCHLY